MQDLLKDDKHDSALKTRPEYSRSKPSEQSCQALILIVPYHSFHDTVVVFRRWRCARCWCWSVDNTRWRRGCWLRTSNGSLFAGLLLRLQQRLHQIQRSRDSSSDGTGEWTCHKIYAHRQLIAAVIETSKLFELFVACELDSRIRDITQDGGSKSMEQCSKSIVFYNLFSELSLHFLL